jgi:hypothetical protein
MSRGKPLVPIFDEEGMLSIRIMCLVPLVKVGYYCISIHYFLFVSTGYRKYVKKKVGCCKLYKRRKNLRLQSDCYEEFCLNGIQCRVVR